ncbi:sulfurtransferase [Saccharospirillum impatiens]|uniref:sulfurtransferase n=1 Tax=Saccharospirillum impatiens TaxID=169438 RepID=UPI0003FA3BD7|nr:sulfurtransferase [Saccharospirillum impatiens]
MSIAYHPLIEVDQLADWLANPDITPPLLLDCRFNLADPTAGEQDYQQEHLPGAVYGHLDRDLSGTRIPGQTGRHPLPHPEDWQVCLRDWGVNDDTAIVVYDQNNAMFAARAWWLLRWAGASRVQVLNGGMNAWHGPMQTGPDHHPHRAGNITVTCPPDWVISAKQLAQAQPDLTLLDARALPRFLGEEEPMDAKAGHIPGALCADFSGNLDASGHFLAPEALAKRFDRVGNSPHLVSYCGSGVTACHNILALTLAGYPQPRLYAGSWSEWITDPLRPIETIPPKEPIL